MTQRGMRPSAAGRKRVLTGLAIAGATLALTTLPARVQDSDTIQFAAFGDFGKAGSGEASVATLVKSWAPDFIIVLGDNNYELGAASTIDANIGQYYREFISPYKGSYGPGGTVNRFFPALGNHDWGDGFVEPPTVQPHYDYFTLPGNERYYEFVQGPVHLFAIDSDTHEPDGVSSTSVQASWLKSRLAASTAPWKIVYFHHAPYASGTRTADAYMRWPFRAWGATAVLAAHHHHYESLLVENMPYFVSGLGGNGNAYTSFPVRESRLRYRDTLGSMRVTADESRITFEFIATTNALVDTYTIDAPSAPGAPYNLVATGIPTARIDLWWSDTSSDETGFVVERSDDGVSFYELATVGPDVTAYSDLTVNASPTSYRYRVLAQTTSTSPAYSNVALATTVPEPPSATTVTGTATSTSSIRLQWDDVIGDAGYSVYRLSAGAYAHIGTTGPDVRQWNDPARMPATSYTYVVRAVNAGGESPSSAAVTVTTGQLAAPTNLTAAGISSRDIRLDWADNSQGETYFKVLRSTDGTNFGVVAWVPSNGTSYVDGGRTAGTLYHYKVQAYETGGGTSAYSNVATSTTLTSGTAPAPASNLTAAATSVSQISLAWSDNSDNEQGFRIERSNGGAFAVVGSAAANARTFLDGGLQSGVTYSYRVIAYNADGAAAPSNTATASTSSALASPSNLAGQAMSASKVVLTWTDNTSNETGFKMYRATGDGAFSLLGSVGANVTTYTNGNATAATTYRYRVVAYTSSATSLPSNIVTITTPAVPASPTGLTATANSSTKITLTWTDRSSDETHFKVERSENGTSYKTAAWVGANITTYVDNNRQAGRTYHYRVGAHNANGTSAPSNVASATTPSQ